MRETAGEPARLIHDSRMRVLNCSASGCLLAASHPVPVNTVATLHMSFGGRRCEDVVQIVRCRAVPGTRVIYHVAAKFLSVGPPQTASLRYLMRYQISELAGWLSDLRAE